MKKLIYLLLLCSIISCNKEEEPKSLVLKNGFDQTKIPLSKTNQSNIELVIVSFLDANHKNVGTNMYPISFVTVCSMSTGYQVTSVPVQDNAKFLLVSIIFHNNDVTLIEYYSNTINLGEGINRVTINETNTTKAYSVFD